MLCRKFPSKWLMALGVTSNVGKENGGVGGGGGGGGRLALGRALPFSLYHLFR